MTAYEHEAEILQLMEPHIREYCKWKWTAIEMEDRLSEARYVFLVVLRARGIPEERIWAVFRRTLHTYMRPINLVEGRHRFRCRSLDARIRTRSGDAGSPLMDMIAAPQPDPCELIVAALEQRA